MESKFEIERKEEFKKEIQALKNELEFILKSEVPTVCKTVSHYIQLILQYLTGESTLSPSIPDTKGERVNLSSNKFVLLNFLFKQFSIHAFINFLD